MNRILWIGVLIVALTCAYFVTTDIADRRAAHRERIAAEQRNRAIAAELQAEARRQGEIADRAFASWEAEQRRIAAENERTTKEFIDLMNGEPKAKQTQQPANPFVATGR